MYKKRINILNLFLIISIFISILFLSIGYANITAKQLNIDVNVSTTALKDIFISNVQYNSNLSADLTNSKIIDYTGTMLHSNIYLSESETNSYIPYDVTIFNNSDSSKQFKGISYADGFYSNQDIAYRIEGLNSNDIIEQGTSITFNITFYYSSSTISNNQLESYLNFNFDYNFDEESDVNVIIKDNENYEFSGVSQDAPVNLNNIANIKFNIRNENASAIKELKIDVQYSTSTGSKQSAIIYLYDENNTQISSQVVNFQGKQTNTIQTVTFSNINLTSGKKYSVSFDQNSVTNGQVDISGITIIPVF